MNMHKKRIARRGAAFVCAFGVALSAMPVHAAEVKSLEDKTSNLQSQLEGINQDLVTLSNKIAERNQILSNTFKLTLKLTGLIFEAFDLRCMHRNC